tara:strand:+ start:14238 stop:14567 length:330 start_codon:yes stop_codon:yes gene_type:complete
MKIENLQRFAMLSNAIEVASKLIEDIQLTNFEVKLNIHSSQLKVELNGVCETEETGSMIHAWIVEYAEERTIEILKKVVSSKLGELRNMKKSSFNEARAALAELKTIDG